MNHEVVEACDGNEALERLQAMPEIQCVITDWMMPSVDGVELVQRIRAAEFPKYIYMILLTARTDIDDIIVGLEAGADDYLVKPFNARELTARVGIAARIVELEQRLREARDEMSVLALRDGLTGLLNRRTITEHAEAELCRAIREGYSLSLAMLDLDHFKDINDRFGHLKGDVALCLVAGILNNSVRPYDWVGRWGGEEFLLVLPRTNEKQALRIMQRIRERIATTPLPVEGREDECLRVSVGLTIARPDEKTTLDLLLQQADEALYHAKKAGRDRVHLANVNPVEQARRGSPERVAGQT
jgi:two-component system chemotaxis response regulator CheY